jgi:hypothetical protein
MNQLTESFVALKKMVEKKLGASREEVYRFA